MTTENEALLTVEDGLLRRLALIPATIRDAIDIVFRLNVAYLWVDTLHIKLDDENDKKAQIRSMDRVYSTAVLTIACASGGTAEAGLLNIRVDHPLRAQVAERVGQITLTNQPLQDQGVFWNSIWCSRGWTYQEMALSSRIVVITDNLMYVLLVQPWNDPRIQGVLPCCFEGTR